jgi:hypothetical protein
MLRVGAKQTFITAACLALLCAGTAPRAASVAPGAGAGVAADAGQRRKSRARVRRKMSEQTKEGAAADEATWGGAHVQLRVRGGGADVEFDCARGEITEPFKVDAEGRFDLPGTFARQSPGPIRLGKTPAAQTARYSGRIEGHNMTLSVRLAGADQSPETYTLTRGSEGRLWKCR